MNPTQLTGLVVFAASTLMCARAGWGRRVRVWRGLTVASSACLLEVALGLRHHLHDLVIARIAPYGWYASRRPAQVFFIAILLLTFGLLLRSAAKIWRTDRSAGVAATCFLGAMVLFLAEAVSLHAIDAVLYQKLGPVMAIGWMWAAFAAVAAVAAGRSGVQQRLSVR